MAEERIDVVVTDKVDDSVAKKFDAIAGSADRAQTSLDKLKSALANVNVSSVDRLAAAMAKVDSAQARLISAQARLTNAQNAGSIAAQRVALAQQKIATEAARTEAAQARAAAATASAESAQLRLAAAQGRAAATAASAAAAQGQLATATAQAGAAASAGGNSFRAYVASIQAAGNASVNVGTAAQRAATGLNAGSAAANQYSRATRQVNAANANIIAQIQDIGVSLAGGQNPLLVAIQQGSQLSYIASTMEGGVKSLLVQVAKLALAWAPVIAALAAVGFALDQVTDKLNAGAGMDEYIKTLGLTDKEVKKLENTHVTMGDTLTATFQVLGEVLLQTMGLSTQQVQEFFRNTADNILQFMRYAFIGIGAITVALVKTIAKIVVNIGKIFYNAGVAAKNLFLMSIELLVNGTIDGINGIGRAINGLSEAAGFGKVVGELDKINLGVGGVNQGMMALSEVDFLGDLNEAARAADANLKAIGERAQQIARDRVGAQAAEIIADRTPKAGRSPRGAKEAVDRTEEKRADALKLVNMQLDDELSRMKLLRGEREIQQRMDQITQQLARKNIELSDAERVALEDKVRAIENFKRVQSEMDRIYEDVNGPAMAYKDTLAAIDELMKQNAITTDQATQRQNIALRTMQEATDVLFGLREGLEKQEAVLGLYGQALEQANFYEQIRQQMLREGTILSMTYVAGVNAEVDALMRRNAALQQGQYIQSQAAQFIDPAMEQNMFIQNYQAIYDEIQRMRQTDLGNEAAYQQALYGLQARYNEMRLSGASSFFGELANVTKNGTGVIGGISKAAAIAQATIDGYVAVQKALASLPPPFNFAAAAAVAVKTGIQVAGIVSTNAGSFATGGQFMVDGKSGVDANNINMNVTRGERVTVETPAQQRANDAGGMAPNISFNPKIVNVTDPKEALAALDTSDGEQLVINIIERNASVIQNLMGTR